MKKIRNFLISLVIILLFFYTWKIVQVNSYKLDKIYLYLFLVILSMVSDRFFYNGQKSDNKKEHDITGYYLSLTWFAALIAPVLDPKIW